jgi:lantibiotic biosynthesis protein
MSSSRAPGFRAGDGIVFRTPALPVALLRDWQGDVEATRSRLAALVDDAAVREALFVASPSLSDAIEVWRKAPLSAAGQRAEHALVKYLARMMARATPFGLFSAVSVGQLGKVTSLQLAPRSEYRRRTRIDNDYLFALADHIARSPEARAKLSYRPNTSLYQSAGRVRYAVAQLDGKERRYHLASAELTPYLESTLALAVSGVTRADLATALVSDEVTLDEATAFIDELIEEQLLVSELGVQVTGDEPVDAFIGQLRAAGLDELVPTLEHVRGELGAIDAAGVGNSPDRYRSVAAALEPLPTKADLARLFQVDMVKPAAATLGARVVAEVARVIEQLAAILPGGDRALADFKQAFRDRYEDATVPLAQVLDEDSGIGFETSHGPGSEGAPLLAGLAFGGSAGDSQASWSSLDRFMLNRLSVALRTGAEEIVLEAADLEPLKVREPAPLPDAFAAMLRLEANATDPAGDPTVSFESADGPPGAKLLGRFAHASREIEAIVRTNLAAEQALRPDAVFAEIVHLNEGRIGNVLCRPVLRSHEIVYLGLSGAPRDGQITLDDLLITLREDRVVLLSKRLGKQVVPRLTTAHNFRGPRSIGVYRFLCALALQGTRGVAWTWGALSSSPYLPRVRIGRVIVERARWLLDKADLAGITTAVRAASKQPAQRGGVLEAVAALRAARKLPRRFVLVEWDNELPIDLDNPLLAAAFADEVAGQDSAQLSELFPSVERPIVHGPEGGYSNEVVVTFVRTRDASQPLVARPRPTIRREFSPGSEWLFAKVYCGESVGDRVLAEVVAPVVREASERGDIDRWFFIRYRDPDPHIRVRFHGEPGVLLERVLPALARSLAPLLDVGAARKLVLDTYVREIERYGGDLGIELVEEVFWRDSEAVLGIVELLEGAEGAVARWKLALRGIDSLLEALGFPVAGRAQIYMTGRDMLGREYQAGPPMWTQLGERFTRERADLDLVCARDPARDAGHDLEPGFELLARRDKALAAAAAELQRRDNAGQLFPRLADLGWSISHMHANRLLHASQRAQEMVLYDFLRRLYAARKARG